MRRIILAVTIVGTMMTGIGAAAALPPGGTFTDDDGNTHEGYIEAIARAGITNGCNPPVNDRYCPDQAITRGQMAAFLVKAVGLSTGNSGDWFSDDEDSVFEDAINAIAAAGITKGCNPPANTNYCPDRAVTRAEMAAFLVRAFHIGASGTDAFNDDDGLALEPAINALAASGITRGCNPPVNNRYCPHDQVRRDQMASFVGRAAGLSPTTPPPRIDMSDVDVVVNPGDDLAQMASDYPAGTVFLVNGEHHGQVVYPKDNQAFIAGDNAVMNGDGWGRHAFGGTAANVTVRGFEVTNYNNPPQWGAIHGQGPGWVVEYNEVHHNATTGIRVENVGPVVRNNYIHHNRQLGIAASASTNGLIEDNEISYNNYTVEYDWGWEAGGSKFWSNTGLVIRGNYVHDNHGPGLWSDVNNYNTLYENNTVVNNFAAGIFHEISYDAVIRNNTSRGNGWGDPAWVWGAGIVISSSLNVEIYGNHVEGNFNGITAAQQNRAGSLGDRGEYIVRNIYVHDNEVVNSGISGVATDTGDSSIWSANNRFENNHYFGNVQWVWTGSTQSWSGWQANGQDNGGSYQP
jgi:parallel beta-helix repeat protein